MLDQTELANRYFNRRMQTVFIDRVCKLGVETFEKYLSYRYRDMCYYYSGYAIMGLNDDDYLMRGKLCIPRSSSWKNGGYAHGWVEFKYLGQEYVFDSMCTRIEPKDEWYEYFKPEITFKKSKKELLESFAMENDESLGKNCYRIRSVKTNGGYISYVYMDGILYMQGNKVKKFISYAPPSG